MPSQDVHRSLGECRSLSHAVEQTPLTCLRVFPSLSTGEIKQPPLAASWLAVSNLVSRWESLPSLFFFLRLLFMYVVLLYRGSTQLSPSLLLTLKHERLGFLGCSSVCPGAFLSQPRYPWECVCCPALSSRSPPASPPFPIPHLARYTADSSCA